MMNDEEQIRELYRLYWKYMIDKDVNGLHEIQSEDYFLCHMTGVKQTRAEFEKGLLHGTFSLQKPCRNRDLEIFFGYAVGSVVLWHCSGSSGRQSTRRPITLKGVTRESLSVLSGSSWPLHRRSQT